MAKGSPRGSGGVTVRHRRTCFFRSGGRCSCKPGYQAYVWSTRDGKLIRKTFPTMAAAKAWRDDARTAVRRGTMRAPTTVTLREAAEAWLAGARDGTIRNRSGELYKPSALNGYEAALNNRILPALGGRKLSDVGRSDVQDFADRLVAEGLSASTVRNALMPLRAILRRAVARGELAVSATAGVELPAVRGRRDRIASPEEAAALVAALPTTYDRALWGTALYAGLRLGELLALRWSDVDLAGGIIRVERAYDPKSKVFIEVKSRAGRRRVPMVPRLRELLLDRKLEVDAGGDDLVFGRPDGAPFAHPSIRDRAMRSWRITGLEPIGLHEARHTFASLMIAAGVGAKAISSYMGHASITITLDRYGHLMPGSEDEAAALLDAYLTRADTAARLAQIDR
jgi:integrase